MSIVMGSILISPLLFVSSLTGTYILPGGLATSRAIAPFETEAIEKHSYVRDAFGDEWSYEEKRVVAPIRCGGIDKSFGKQVLILGDAAGHVDPLTGIGSTCTMQDLHHNRQEY